MVTLVMFIWYKLSHYKENPSILLDDLCNSLPARMSNGLDPDQDQRSVGPDLGPNCLQRLSAEDKSSLVHIQQVMPPNGYTCDA